MKTTQNTKIFVPLILIGLFMTTFLVGCRSDSEDNTFPFIVNVVAPAELPDLDMTTIVVTMTNLQGGVFPGNLNANGSVTLHVVAGIYSVIVIGEITMPNGETAIIQGIESDIIITRDGANQVAVELDIVHTPSLIIREIYFGGGPAVASIDPETGDTTFANWNRDQYIEIFNNGNSVVFLDSLIIGGLAPTNGFNANPNHNTWPEVDRVAFFGSMWMVPGSGTDFPLLPGQGAVFAPEAVDHSAPPRNALSGLDLSRAHFAMFNAQQHTAQTEPAVGVIILEMLTAPQGNRYTLSVSSPAVVIARIPNMQTEWWDRMDEFHLQQPGSTAATRHWTIRPEWIIDGIDVTTPAAAQGSTNVTKRVPTHIDLTFTYLQNGNTVGDALTRRLDRVENGRNIYQVTRNSAADFVTARPNPRLR
ncbi:MAG: DUF4876 domain-containing protein [Bacteroidales bacterium]|nr:DUF4876 domain-containing protein [Bacteroidales bacterium]